MERLEGEEGELVAAGEGDGVVVDAEPRGEVVAFL